METLLVNKRFGEWVDVRDFVRPNDAMVADVVDARRDWTLEAMWDWVLENIAYPAGDLLVLDLHAMSAYRSRIPLIGWLFAARRYATIDFWNFPAETLRDRVGDCEDTSVLLASMIRRALPNLATYVSVGYFCPPGCDRSRGFGHVWVSVRDAVGWRILDTTLRHRPSRPVYEGKDGRYLAIFRFSDREVILVDRSLAVPERLHQPGKDRALRSWYAIVEAGLRRG